MLKARRFPSGGADIVEIYSWSQYNKYGNQGKKSLSKILCFKIIYLFYNQELENPTGRFSDKSTSFPQKAYNSCHMKHELQNLD